MPQLHTFPAADLSAHLKWQVLDFLRMEWPDGFAGANLLRTWISPPEQHALHVVLVEGEILISHAEVKQKALPHDGVV